MKRMSVVMALVAAVLVMAALPAYAQGGEGDAETVARGAALYAEFCQACHGPQGEGAAAGPSFAAVTYDDEAARSALEQGARNDAGGVMPAYADILGEEGQAEVLAYMATWGTGTTPALPEPNLYGEAETLAGAAIYAKTCYGCHAAEGAGRDAESFPAIEWPHNSLETIATVSIGGDLGIWHAFGAASGGPLSDAQLSELDAYARTWGEVGNAEKSDLASDTIAGMDVLLVMIGVAAILIVGVAYGTSIIRTES